MAVPPQALPFWIMLGESATRYDFCGTVITVPYKDMENVRRNLRRALQTVKEP